MRRITARLAVAGLLVTAPSVAMSQTNISQNAQFSPSSTVQYLPFAVSTGGTFNLFTSGLAPLDPMIMLFSNASANGAGLGALLAADDDGGAAQPGWNRCGGAGGTCHSSIFGLLAAGDYTLVYSVFQLTEAEARSGASNFGLDQPTPDYCMSDGNWADCNYDVNIVSRDGVATVTPEPASLTLFATGLLGVIGAVRRKRNARMDA
jgi:hypothetical protein